MEREARQRPLLGGEATAKEIAIARWEVAAERKQREEAEAERAGGGWRSGRRGPLPVELPSEDGLLRLRLNGKRRRRRPLPSRSSIRRSYRTGRWRRNSRHQFFKAASGVEGGVRVFRGGGGGEHECKGGGRE